MGEYTVFTVYLSICESGPIIHVSMITQLVYPINHPPNLNGGSNMVLSWIVLHMGFIDENSHAH